ncbi:MAG: restriction endonuclease subunit S [Oscillospiraceae bacterium]|jgi:type I restriction enzyme S subunit|nr:restriction endonuclease subunit S [Oscillospiraceae bacterium]
MPKVKKQALTQEELLAQMLVPENEQPYDVPGNWVWTTLDCVAEYKKGPFGSSITKAMFVPKGKNTYKVYEQGNAIRKDPHYGDYYINSDKYKELQSNAVLPFDLIVSCAGTIGEIYQLPEEIYPGIINQALMRVRVKKIILTDIFLSYFGEVITQDISLKSKGTAIKNIPPFSVLKKIAFPLPPLAEQRRIITRIESLFEKLDRAKELVQSALDSFENRKAAILHMAFTGELTAKWREENGVNLDSWEEKPLKEITKMRSGYAFDSKQFVSNGYQVVRMGNLYNGVLDLSRAPVFMSEGSINNDILDKFTAKKGDILLTLTGTKYKRDYGYAVLIEDNCGLLVNQRILSLTPQNIVQNYLLYYLRSDIFRDIFFSKETGGVNQGNVSSTFVSNIELRLPSPLEQKEIVRILDNILGNEKTAQELSDTLERVDHMKKAILARAFRGELGTNDPNEESAIELLKKSIETL